MAKFQTRLGTSRWGTLVGNEKDGSLTQERGYSLEEQTWASPGVCGD